MNKLLLSLLLVVGLSGCKTTHPIYNADSQLAVTNVSNAIMSKSIVSALRYKGWKVLSKTDNEIIGTINVRSHYAKIKINFDGEKYTIKHMESTNLDYNAAKQGIHRNYNRWIKMLEAEISRSAEIATSN